MSRINSATGRSALSWSRVRVGWRTRAADYIELTKPRIIVLELVTVIVAAHLAAPWGINSWVLLHTVIGAALVAASAGALNQWWEQATDARMVRTADRPLPTGRLNTAEVVIFGALTLISGFTQLAWLVNSTTALVALATWLIYVLIYTPLKSRSPLNTAVGAVSGALPILIGWTAAEATIDIRALTLASAIFLWQFPHFMAIAWLYRTDYHRAGQKMLTVVDPTGIRAGAQAVIAAAALIPVSMVIALSPQAGSPAIYCVWALILGVAQLVAATLFFIRRDDLSARRLLRASLVYMCCWMGLLLLVAV